MWLTLPHQTDSLCCMSGANCGEMPNVHMTKTKSRSGWLWPVNDDLVTPNNAHFLGMDTRP